MPNFGHIYSKRQVCLQILQARRELLSKIFMLVNWHTAILNNILVAKFVGKHQPCFPIFFIPKKDIAA